jgi:flagellar biosynthesis/type III secretory pathway chaperone
MMRADSNPAVALLDELVRCLHAESDALVAGDLERLNEAALRKNDVLAQLAPLLKHSSETERRQHDKVLRAAQHFNERNARILAQRMSMNRARAETLLNAAGARLYGSDGAVVSKHAAYAARARA